MKEADVQRWITDQLKEHFKDRIYIFKVPQAQYISRRGIPDLIACVDGVFVGIEVKMEHGKLTALQKHEISCINKAGGTALTIYGKDKEILNGLIKMLDAK